MDIIPTPKTNIVVDATMLTAIMKCGRFADLQHNHNFQSIRGKSNSLEVGSIIHKFLEIYYGSQMKGISRNQAFGFGMAAAELYIQGCKDCTNFEPSLCEGCEIIKTAYDGKTVGCSECKLKPKCGHPINEYPGLTNTPAESEGYVTGWKFALQTCDEYVKHYQSDYWVTVDVETVRSKILYEDDEIRILFKSKLDWVVDTNQGIYPCDHKTMKQNSDTLSINNQFMGQCRILDTRNVFINKIGLQKTLKPEEKFKRVSVPYSADRLMEWQSYILPYWCKQYLTYHEQAHFPPNFNSCKGQYGKCNFYEVCEANPDDRQRVLNTNFYVGREWNPTNSEE